MITKFMKRSSSRPKCSIKLSSRPMKRKNHKLITSLQTIWKIIKALPTLWAQLSTQSWKGHSSHSQGPLELRLSKLKCNKLKSILSHRCRPVKLITCPKVCSLSLVIRTGQWSVLKTPTTQAPILTSTRSSASSRHLQAYQESTTSNLTHLQVVMFLSSWAHSPWPGKKAKAWVQ